MTSVTMVPPRPVTVSMRRRAGEQVVRPNAGSRSTRCTPPGVGVLGDREVAVERIVTDLVVERGVVDGHAQVGFLEDVGDAPAAVPEGAAVAQRREVLVGGREAHRGTLDGGRKLTR